jgi:hypothetical protein
MRAPVCLSVTRKRLSPARNHANAQRGKSQTPAAEENHRLALTRVILSFR